MPTTTKFLPLFASKQSQQHCGRGKFERQRRSLRNATPNSLASKSLWANGGGGTDVENVPMWRDVTGLMPTPAHGIPGPLIAGCFLMPPWIFPGLGQIVQSRTATLDNSHMPRLAPPGPITSLTYSSHRSWSYHVDNGGQLWVP